MIYDLPFSVKIGEDEYKIRNSCDYRVVLDVFEIYNDDEIPENYKYISAIIVFYEKFEKYEDIEEENISELAEKMLNVIDFCQPKSASTAKNKKVMDWNQDFKFIAPAVSRVLGYDVRNPNKSTHWWTFLGAYLEIGDCAFTNILSIRRKRFSGKKLEKWEQDFYREFKNDIDFEKKLTAEENEWILSED